jgi:hypothetical protein
MSVAEDGAHGAQHNGRGRKATAVLHVGGLHYASEKAVVERVLANRPGVARVDANPVAQTATVEYDPGGDVGRGAAAVGRGLRLPLRGALRAGPRLRSTRPGGAACAGTRPRRR